MNFDKAHQKVEQLLDSEDDATDLIVLMAQTELRKRGLL